MKQVFSLFDELTGELVSRTETTRKNLIGDEWIVVYDKMLKKLLEDNPPYAIVRVYLKLALMQTFDTHIVTTIANVARELGMTYKTAWQSFKWLEENEYLKKSELRGMATYLLNPNFTTRGRASLAEKRAKWQMSFKREG